MNNVHNLVHIMKEINWKIAIEVSKKNRLWVNVTKLFTYFKHKALKFIQQIERKNFTMLAMTTWNHSLTALHTLIIFWNYYLFHFETIFLTIHNNKTWNIMKRVSYIFCLYDGTLLCPKLFSNAVLRLHFSHCNDLS